MAPMLLLALWALAALVIWAIVHVGARDDPPEWDEPDVQPPDPYPWYSLTGTDGGPVEFRIH
jgi:hypothetical protein